MIDRGTGVPMVFLHAGSGNAALWQGQVEFFSGAGYRCIAYDRHGRAAAADELEALVSQLALERFHLVGTAAGGIVAVDYALSFPKRLRSLVIANSIFGIQDKEYLALQKRLRPSPQFEALPVEVRELGPSYRSANAQGTRQWARASRHAKSQPTRKTITYAALETIKAPTLLLTGDADLYMPPTLLREVAIHIKGATTVIVPECGHSAYWEQPGIFNRMVLDFLKSLG
jgi:pimeloyl-ACP methyl ester carboxylesterase